MLIERFKGLASVGATHISNWMMVGGMEHEKLMRSIRLMGEQVIPALKDVTPPPGLARDMLNESVMSNEEIQAGRYSRAPRDMPT